MSLRASLYFSYKKIYLKIYFLAPYTSIAVGYMLLIIDKSAAGNSWPLTLLKRVNLSDDRPIIYDILMLPPLSKSS